LGACERAEKYVEGALRALDSIEGELGAEYSRLVDAARRYLSDARYYLDSGDCETALVAASYAEGLIDSLKYLGVVEAKWPGHEDIVKPRVFVAGTFDLLHPGHVSLLEHASKLGRVYVVVARDSTVEKLKGKRPVLSETSRLRVVGSVRYVYDAVLGDPEDMLAPVEKIKPDIIVLGPDQPFDEDELAETIESRLGYRPRIVRYPEKRPFEDNLASTSDIIRRICCGSYCAGTQCAQGAGRSS